MRTSAVGFTPSFFRPLVSDEPEPSRPAGQEQEPLIYSSQKHGRLEEFIASTDFKEFRDEYKAVLKSIKAFVQDHANDLTPPLSDEIRNKVNNQFGALEKRLFDASGGGLDTPVAKEHMYGAGKRVFHEFAELLQDKGILLQNRMNAVLTLTGRLEFCFGGISSDLSDVTAILMACKYGLKGHAQQWKIKMLDELILQYVKATHHHRPGEEIHFVNAYYNYLADEMGVAQREDSYVRSYQGNIHQEQLEACRRHAHANLTPLRLAAYAADHYRSRIEEFLSNENIKKDEIDKDGFDKLKEMMKALIPEYGDVAQPVVVEPDPDTYQLAYSGRQQPVRGTRHFLKAFRKLGVIDYDKQSKVVLGQIEEGRIAMRDDLLYVKEQKRATPYELTASSLFKLAPEELLANMEKAEPEDMQARSAMLRMVIHHAYQAVTVEGDTGERLETWLRGFVEAMKERPSWPQGWTDPVILLAAFFGKASTLRDLLEAGGDKNAVDENGMTVLMLAVQERHVETVEVLLEKEANIEAKDAEGRTALMWAAETDHAGMAAALLEKKANIEAKDADGRTALMWAVGMGHAGVAEILLEKEANIEVKDPNGRTALLLASQLGHVGVVEALLKKEANKEAKDQHGSTPLVLAVAKGHTEVVEALLKAEADKEVTDQYGRAALLLASQLGHAGVAAALLEKGANIEAKDPNGRTALLLASQLGHAEVVATLLAKGANIEAKDPNGRTALVFAVENGHAGVVEALLKKGVDKKTKDRLLLRAAGRMAEGGDHVGVVEVLLKEGADMEAKNFYGCTPLLLAATVGHVGTVETLLEKGANIEAKDERVEFNVLMWAAIFGQTEAAKVLMQHGAGGNEALRAIAMKKSQVEIFVTPSLWGKVKTWVSGGDEAAIKAVTTLLQAGADGVTALLELAEQDAGSSLRFLIRAGADKARDAQGKTALMKAVEMTVSDNDSDSEKGKKVLKALLDAGADESIKDNEGRTAEEHAERAAGLENNKAFRVFLEVAASKKEGSWALWR